MNPPQKLPASAEQTPLSSVEPTGPLPPLKSRRRHIPNLASWIVAVIVILLVAGVCLPVFNTVALKGPQTQSLARAKQIGLALKIFAGDHDGSYPRAGLPAMLGSKVEDSNAAFAVLFPEYLTNETIFGNQLSAYQTRAPDNQYDNPYTGKPVRTLEPGENVYAYVAGLTEKSVPATPLLADGTDGTGHYTTDLKKRGGVWEGKKAVVIRLDNSGSLETLAGPDHARYIPRRDGDPEPGTGNLLDVSTLGLDVRLLDPAVGSR